MLMFSISLFFFVLAAVAFTVMLGLWVYADAKARTGRPVTWTLIVLLVPYMLGLVIYLLVGRNNNGK